MLEQINVALENGERIEIRGFDSFTLRHQSVRLRYPIVRSEH
jgi:nucleoid DNA-binding protein